MKNKIKKIIIILMTLVIIYPNSYAAGNFFDKFYIPGLNYQSDYTDQLLDSRTEALVSNNLDDYEKINNQLKSSGVEEISLKEVIELTENPKEIGLSLDTYNRNTNVKFYKEEFTQSSNGKKYKIMKITAVPNSTSGLLYKSGNTTQRNSTSKSAKAMSLIGITAYSAAGIISDKIGTFLSVYDAIKDAFGVLDPYTTVENIQASYAWNVGVNCSFIYVFDSNLGSYKLSARYHKASAAVGVDIPTLNLKNKNARTSVLQWNKTGDVTPSNYNSVSTAINYYEKGAVYSSSVSRVNITGLEEKTVNTVYLPNPYTPSEAGYY